MSTFSIIDPRQRQPIGNPNLIDPWKLFSSTEYPLSNQGPFLTFLKPRSQLKTHGQHILRLKAWFETLEKQETPCQQHGSKRQNQGSGDLEDQQEIAERKTAWSAEGDSSLLQNLCQIQPADGG